MWFRLSLSLLASLPCPPLSVYLVRGRGAQSSASLVVWVSAVLVFFFVSWGIGLVIAGIAVGHAIVTLTAAAYGGWRGEIGRIDASRPNS